MDSNSIAFLTCMDYHKHKPVLLTLMSSLEMRLRHNDIEPMLQKRIHSIVSYIVSNCREVRERI